MMVRADHKTIAGILLIVLWNAVGAAKERETEHFYVFAKTADWDRGKITATHFDRCANLLEVTYARLVEDLRFPPPQVSPDPLISDPALPWDKGKIIVRLYNAPDSDSGGLLGPDGVLELNVTTIQRPCEFSPDGSVTILQGVTAHELFHAVQNAYDPRENVWFKEATAVWAESVVYPNLQTYLRHEPAFLDHMNMSLQWEAGSISGGHPYGASLFLRFLVAQSGRPGLDVVKAIWKKCAERDGPNALEAISQFLGGTKALDNEFRSLYDRFAVGCALHSEAPTGCLLPEVEQLKADDGSPKTAKTSEWVDWSWTDHLENTYRSPETSICSIDIENLHGCGTVFARIKPPAGLPASVPLDIAIKAAQNELSVQALVDGGAGWRVLQADYSGTGRHELRVDGFGNARKGVILIVTRYSEDPSVKDYELRMAAADPPVLLKVGFLQGGTEVIMQEWNQPRGGKRTCTGYTREIDPTIPVELTLLFSHRIRGVDNKPILTVDGQPLMLQRARGAELYRAFIPQKTLSQSAEPHVLAIRGGAEIPGTKAYLPLDENPGTVVRVGSTGGEEYERSNSGMRIEFHEAKRVGGFQAEDSKQIDSEFFANVEVGKEGSWIASDYVASDGPTFAWHIQKFPSRAEAVKQLKRYSGWSSNRGVADPSDSGIPASAPPVSMFYEFIDSVSGELKDKGYWMGYLERNDVIWREGSGKPPDDMQEKNVAVDCQITRGKEEAIGYCAMKGTMYDAFRGVWDPPSAKSELESFLLCRDVFIIRFGAHVDSVHAGISADAAYTDFASKRLEVNKRSKQLIDKRFPRKESAVAD
ncbi:MAG: hypothetical protein ABIP48_26220 [Planctomycetota bacterium]